jgi:hypothetical protein
MSAFFPVYLEAVCVILLGRAVSAEIKKKNLDTDQPWWTKF